MRTAFEWRAPALAATCLIVMAAAGLVRVEQASAEQRGEVSYVGGCEAIAPQTNAASAASAAPGTCAGGTCSSCSNGACAACPDDSDQQCPACSGRGCKHCNGTGIFRGCDQCRKELRDGHRGLLLHHGYWDGRHECEEAPYGTDDMGQSCEPRWAATAGAIAMRRSTARKAVVVQNSNQISLISIDDLDLDWAAGPRVNLIRRFEGFDVEFIYWGIDSWNGGKVVTGDSNLVVPVNGFNSRGFSVAGAEYQSRLYNGESNLKLRMAEAVNLIVGGRVMEMHEKFFVGAGTGTLDAVTDNYLYGLQVGADTDVPVWAGISFNVFVKAGCFDNHVNQRWTTASVPAGSVGGGSVAQDKVAFVGEAGAMGTWQLNKNLGLYGGYEWMFIDGVVLAPDIATTTVVRTNTPTFDGAIFGATLQW